MKDVLAISITNVDELHAHFAEWIKFLKAKGQELEAQLAKLEAKKAKAGITAQVISTGSDSATPSLPHDEAGEQDFLDIVFRAQAQNKTNAHEQEPPSQETALNDDDPEKKEPGLDSNGSTPQVIKTRETGDLQTNPEVELPGDKELR